MIYPGRPRISTKILICERKRETGKESQRGRCEQKLGQEMLCG